MKNPFEGNFIRNIEKKIRGEKHKDKDLGKDEKLDEIRTFRADEEGEKMPRRVHNKEELPPIADEYVEKDMEKSKLDEKTKDDFCNAGHKRKREYKREVQRNKERREERDKRQL